ncbi:TIR domain-containing protein [Candidatus Viadribacter manganicus]|uniref:TIR domain-containing protein n=1 Tax=Candidatus Viadribacter manganicus TaxID=1759059 RepID=A0A1B1AML6_9PROT|nr:TIR domain-containing protein [Candidatus Viadribacter manganicus]ANP47791.1 hypothetical protein ATE48_18750 [Candidatus Viadribacter manganicus]
MVETEAATNPSERLKVFVSYSRTDLDFADQLVLALEDKGFEALVDRHDIDAAEKWKDRLGTLIASCDTVVFVLSEKSAGSPICAWEVEEAALLGKRIIPVVPHDPAGVAPPPQLGELNYIHFFRHPNVPGSGFYDGVQKLDRALRVNLGWLRRQTAYAERADEWRAQTGAARRPEDHLLRASALEEAEAWLASAPKNATVSPLVREYIVASQEAETRRKAETAANIAERERALKTARIATLIGGGVAFALIVLAVGLSAMAVTASREAGRNRAAVFAGEAEARMGQAKYAEAMLMALGGDPAGARNQIATLDFSGAGYPAASSALALAMTQNRFVRLFPDYSQGDGIEAVFSPDDTKILTYPEGNGDSASDEARIFTIEGRELGRLALGEAFDVATVPGPGWRILVASRTGVRLWDVEARRQLGVLSTTYTHSVTVSADGRRALTFGDDSMEVWDIQTSVLVRSFPGAVWTGGELSGDGSQILMSTPQEATLRNVDTGQITDTIATYSTNALALSSGGERVLVASIERRRVFLGDRNSTPRTFTAEVEDAHFLGDGRVLLGLFSSGRVALWTPQSGASEEFSVAAVSAWPLVVSHNGRHALAHGSQGLLLLNLEPRAPDVIDPRARRIDYGWSSDNGRNYGSAVFSGDGARLWVRSAEGSRVQNAETGALAYALEGTTLAAFSADGRRIVTLSGERTIVLRDAADGRQLNSVQVPDQVTTLAFAGDDVLIGSQFVRSWRPVTGRLEQLLNSETYVRSMAFQPERNLLLAGTDAGAQLWDLRSRNRLHLLAPGAEIGAVALSRDGRLAATADHSWDSWTPTEGRTWKIVLWDLASGRRLQVFGLPPAGIYPPRPVSLAISGDRLMAGMSNGAALSFALHPIVWEDAPTRVRMACATLRALGMTEYTVEDLQRFPILQNEARNPCSAVH